MWYGGDPECDEAVSGKLVEPAPGGVRQSVDCLGKSHDESSVDGRANRLLEDERGHSKVTDDDDGLDSGRSHPEKFFDCFRRELCAGVGRALASGNRIKVGGPTALEGRREVVHAELPRRAPWFATAARTSA